MVSFPITHIPIFDTFV